MLTAAEYEPRKRPAKELTRRDYKEVRDHVAECIGSLKALGEILPEHRNIPAEEVATDCFCEHEKGGNVYGFRVPSRKIRAKIRIRHVLRIIFRGFSEFLRRRREN